MSRAFIQHVLVVLLFVGLAVLGIWLSRVLLLVFGAVVVSEILIGIGQPLTRWTRAPRWLAVLVAVILILGLFVLGGWMLGTQIAGQFDTIREQIPRAWLALQQQLDASPVGQRVLALFRDASPNGDTIAPHAARIVQSTTGAIAEVLLVVVAGIFLALHAKEYRAGLILLVPKDRADTMKRATDTVGVALRRWFLGQLISMTVVGVLTGVGLAIVGVPSSAALGFIAGLCEFVPILGPVVAGVPGLLLAWASGSDVALWALGVYLVVQQLENNVVMPLIEERAVSVPPVLTLFGVLTMGVLFGVVGIILAAPFVVFVYVLVLQLYVRETLDHSVELSSERSSRTSRVDDD